MPQVSLRMKCADASQYRIYEGKVFLPLFVADVDDTFRGKQHSIPRVARRHDTVEHVYAQGNALQDILRGTHTHKIAGFVPWQYATDQFCHGVHFVSRFSHRQSANGISRLIPAGYKRCGAFAQLRKGTALYDWK